MNLTKLSPPQEELLRSLADGNVRQVRVATVRQTGLGSVCNGTSVRLSTIRAVAKAGFITVKQEQYRETEQGRNEWVTLTDAKITPAGVRYLAARGTP